MRGEYIVLIVLGLFLSSILLTACSETENCNEYSWEECPEDCWICPPCPACTNITCQTPEFCQGQGYEEEWYSSEV
ncbi:hypothetical protein GF345_03440 [Candidatus Woesearchaeota archaeon]|nr:hypothetical protein [Candidatus Woesearchaeota archaeon]